MRPRWIEITVQLSDSLEWPSHVPRTPPEERKRAKFGRRNERGWGLKNRTKAEARDYVAQELDRFCDDDPVAVISTDADVNKDEWCFTANRTDPDDPGVAVYFDTDDGQRQVLAIDVYDRLADNLWAVGRTIEALRQIERDGGPQIGAAAVSGFKAIPETTGGPSWWETLEVEKDASGDEIREAYRRRAREVHPDRGGDHDEFVAVQEALRQGLAAREGRVA